MKKVGGIYLKNEREKNDCRVGKVNEMNKHWHNAK